MTAAILETTITCPACRTSTHETMPTDACVWFYTCPACHALLRPQPGDCCVFCTYATIACPPAQTSDDCCAKA